MAGDGPAEPSEPPHPSPKTEEELNPPFHFFGTGGFVWWDSDPEKNKKKIKLTLFLAKLILLPDRHEYI